jgi:hypothetical protein
VLERCQSENATVDDSLGSVTVVGTGLGEDISTYDILAKEFGDWPNELSDASWTAWLPPEHVDATVRRIHEAVAINSIT